MTRAQILAGLLLFLAGCLLGREWRDRSAEIAAGKQEVKQLAGQVQAEQQARAVEQKQSQAQQAAGDTADKREAQINADYDKRLASAGNGGDHGRLSQLWGQCETDRLSERAATAAEAAGQDRLRRESAARIVRDVESVQSERDEVIERYQALAGPADAKQI